MNALLAFDKFKGALRADQACAVAAQALARAQPSWTIEQAPFADGGDGFCETLSHAAAGTLHHAEVLGPLGHPTRAHFAIVDPANLPPDARALLDLPSPCSRLAILELAQSSGIALLRPDQLDPWQTSTYGFGQLIQAALDAGADALLVGLGGSATHDLALGALQALGIQFLDAQQNPIPRPPSPATWSHLQAIAPAHRAFPPLRIACDVQNPLLGPDGAAAIFGPQKGLQPPDLPRLDALTRHAATLLVAAYHRHHQTMDTPGSGAAGGAAFGLATALGGLILPGSALVAAWTDFAPKLARADLLLTGEGRFDASSLGGKGPGYALAQAASLGKPAYVFAGSLGPLPPRFPHATLAAISPPPQPPPPPRAPNPPPQYLAPISPGSLFYMNQMPGILLNLQSGT